MATPTMIPAGWYPDPAHRHEYRYWSGSDWSALVSDHAVTATDQLQVPAAPPSSAHDPGAMPPPAPAPAVPGPRMAAAPPAPAYGPPAPAYGPPAPVYPQPAPAPDPRFATAVAEYTKRGYRIVSGTGGTMTVERPATKFNWLLAVLLLILFGVLVIPYVLIWAIWGVHKTYTATISLGPQGEVQEMGDVAAVYDRDRLLAHRKRCIGFGVFFALATVFMAIAEVVAVVQATSGKLAVGLVGTFLFVLLPAAITFLLYRASRKTARTLGMPAAEWWRI